MAVDLGSTNGTRVNDLPVELVALRHGDHIGQVGSEDFAPVSPPIRPA